MKLQFLDSNIILRHFLRDISTQSKAATAYLSSVEKGEVDVRIADTVIFEVVFTLERTYGYSKAKIREGLLPLISLPGIMLPGKRRIKQALDLYVNLNLPFADAYYAVQMEKLKINEIVSFDRHFDRIPGVRRVKP